VSTTHSQGHSTPIQKTAPASGAQLARPGLHELTDLPLDEASKRALAPLLEDMQGRPAWRMRKYNEAHGLVALSSIAPRLRILDLDLRTELKALVELRDTPVPCMAPGASDIHIESRALLAIEYPEEILYKPIPGTRPIRLLAPRHVWHSNVGPAGVPAPALCLGASIARGFPLREMVLCCYAALTLQAISLDHMDPAGVLNGEAARWWQANAGRIPLTTEPFLPLGAAGLTQSGGRPAVSRPSDPADAREDRS